MRVAHYQGRCKGADIEGNLATVRTAVSRAAELGVDVLTFPECFLNGYLDDAEVTRQTSLTMDCPAITAIRVEFSKSPVTIVLGFNELRAGKIYNTSVVIEEGQILGHFSKCMAYNPWHVQGRQFPVFEKKNVRYGIVICADGGYVEPTRILALKGADLILAPHYNSIGVGQVLQHRVSVFRDHQARATENGVWFLRGNNVESVEAAEAEGRCCYGDSYLIDPRGEVLKRSPLYEEDLLWADIPEPAQRSAGLTAAIDNRRGRSYTSAYEFLPALWEAVRQAPASLHQSLSMEREDGGFDISKAGRPSRPPAGVP